MGIKAIKEKGGTTIDFILPVQDILSAIIALVRGEQEVR